MREREWHEDIDQRQESLRHELSSAHSGNRRRAPFLADDSYLDRRRVRGTRQ
jgi:hypothetical protein